MSSSSKASANPYGGATGLDWSDFRLVARLAIWPALYIGVTFVLAIAAVVFVLLVFLVEMPATLSAVLLVTALLSLLSAGGLILAFRRCDEVGDREFIEIVADDHPELFNFVEDLCSRCHTARPDAIYLYPGANAGIHIKAQGLAILRRPRRNLLIGLGLVNSLNRTELAAVLAHEFAHLTQRSLLLQHYVESLEGVLQRWIDSNLEVPLLSRMLRSVLHHLRDLDQSVSHRMELHADRVAAEIAGSEALLRALEAANRSDRSYTQTLYDLRHALDIELRTEDLYYHHAQLLGRPHPDERATSRRTERRNPNEESRRGDDWDDGPQPERHPSTQTRRAQARRRRRDSPIDHRSAWTLFRDVEKLRRRATDLVYLEQWNADAIAIPAPQLQQFIDGEHDEIILDPEAAVVYGHRFIEPGDLPSAIDEARAIDEEELQQTLNALTGQEFEEARRQMIDQIDADDDDASTDDPQATRRWLARWDRRVLIASLAAARHRDEHSEQILVDHYAFHLHIQELIRWLRQHEAALQSARALVEDDFEQARHSKNGLHLIASLRDELKRGLEAAPKTPNLHGLPPKRPGLMVLLDVSRSDLAGPDGDQLSHRELSRFLRSWRTISRRLDHLRRKSLGALLLYQRRVQTPWLSSDREETVLPTTPNPKEKHRGPPCP